jgi:hypothetical protein
LCGAHHGVSGFFGDLKAGERIGDKKDVHGQSITSQNDVTFYRAIQNCVYLVS